MSFDIAKVATRNPVVAGMITEGVGLTQSALGLFRDAALQFVAGVNSTGLTSEHIPAVVNLAKDLYSEEFADNHNHKAYFGDVVLVALADQTPITFEKTVKEKGEKKKVPVHTTGADAANMSKDDCRAAATALRADLGIGRAKGGGAKGADQKRSDKPETVFSLTEFKTQLAGLFGNSKGAVATINKCLAEYHVVAISKGDYDAFQKWQKATK